MKAVMGEYRRGHARAWSGIKVRSRKPAATVAPGQARRDDAKLWKRRAVTRAGSDHAKRSGPAREAPASSTTS